MYRILFVCHGNICRSPMAEMIMRHLVREAGLENAFVIASVATSSEEIWGGVGNPIYPPAKRTLSAHGIPCLPHRATKMVAADYERYDFIVGMDWANLRNIRRIVGEDRLGKVRLLLEKEEQEVADPWYSGDFERTYEDVMRGCKQLLAEILGE